MTEKDWLACSDPVKMFAHLCDQRGDSRRQGGRRRLRLFACASVREIWHLLRRPGSRHALHQAERHADGLVPDAALREAEQAAREAFADEKWSKDTALFWQAAEAATHLAVKKFDGGDHASVRHASVGAASARAAELTKTGALRACQKTQVALLRDIVGNPFQPVALAVPVSSEVEFLAQAAYEERILPSGHLDNARLGILSDALEEAGCTDEAILSHLRSPAPHVRGCWALDLILGKV